MHEDLTMDAPLWGDAGGHTGTAPTNLHHIFPHNSTQTKQPFAHNPPQWRQPLTRNPPNETTRPRVICPNETVGAVPACPPERSRSGVSIPKKVCVSRIMRGEFNDECALVGRHGRAHRHRPYQYPPNHAVCPYPIGVILSIAQGWQVQRCLPWVTMQAMRLPPWGVVLFPPHCFFMSSHTTHSGAEMHRALPPPFLK